MFQSTRPRGARLGLGTIQGAQAKVSIHAPAWGATSGGVRNVAYGGGFNPRARVGRDYTKDIFVELAEKVSIHAPAWGATPTVFFITPYVKVSIHAPAWGATKTIDRVSMA